MAGVRALASFDVVRWLEDDEFAGVDGGGFKTVEVEVANGAFVEGGILGRSVLWDTDFAIGRRSDAELGVVSEGDYGGIRSDAKEDTGVGRWFVVDLSWFSLVLAGAARELVEGC